MAHSFIIAQSDNYIFYKINYNIYVNVDEILVAKANKDEVQRAELFANSRFILGIQFEFHADGSVSIHQH